MGGVLLDYSRIISPFAVEKDILGGFPGAGNG
jgi:hypothetical protein